MLKLYKAYWKNGDLVAFDGEVLIVSDPAVFYTLIEYQNNKIRDWNELQEKAEKTFNRDYSQLREEEFSTDITYVELTEEELGEIFTVYSKKV